MKAFAELFAKLDESTSTNDKVAAMTAYFGLIAHADAAWAMYFLCGHKPKQVVKVSELRAWVQELTGTPDWLFQESYDAVGDLAETIALLLPAATQTSSKPLATWVEEVLLPLRTQPTEVRRTAVIQAWQSLSAMERFVWNKLITSGFRVGVSQSLVTKALAKVAGLPAPTIAHRLMGDWSPTPQFFAQLLAQDQDQIEISRPYPFYLAHPLEADVTTLGDPEAWHAEWKWDGIRAQLMRRLGETFLWTRGEELVTERYPELRDLAERFPDGTVLDGEILPWRDDHVAPFADLQKRIGRKTVGKKLLADIPVVLMAYDLLELGGEDLRAKPLHERAKHLSDLVSTLASPQLKLSPPVAFSTWEELTKLRLVSREQQVEGLMLKRADSPYRVGRVRGDWWKWKIEPMTMDAVLTAAQKGHGRRASLYTDYTFSVWNNGVLVTIAKAYSGLTDVELGQVDAFIRANTLEKFGPVRTVKPELVFELAFEGIQASPRHKSGIAVRFPRILRQRTDKRPADADTLERVKRLLLVPGVSS
jgi:DNA ligase 1